MKKNNQTKQTQNSKMSAYLLIIAMGIIVLLAILCVVLSFRPTAYEVAKERCGKEPVNASTFAASWSYELPGDKFYNSNGNGATEFFCTESEAQAAGYHHGF